ncbi:DUF680 domain-containing protein [Mesorhizobium sp. INR15]|uniref:DUF680 domain-containing protein n=1 Tax=Mesorhizobium sp. INR15 TaxID=2654248 RepID=UPI0018968751|nr:DUF680 domain-containing protein [Mesorhizobium sp. INR15]QPC93845.1 DUF680 domain-containing protein [Mesorhizobium sp. INR15]
MTKIALTAAAILVATGSAFANGSDHYGSNNVNQPAAPVASVDHSFTGSIRKSDVVQQDGANSKVTIESGQGIWGR